MSLGASVIIRSKNKAETIEKTLWRVRNQSVDSEVIVVDSGSTDATLDIAERYADRIIEIPAARFTFGGALNTGAAAASGDVHFALSAHSFPYSSTWVADSLALYSRDDVAATNHAKRTADRADIVGVHHQSADDVVRHGWWGFSNHGSSWRADVWRDHPFREDLPAVEDKEWSWRVIAAGWTIAYAPHLAVSNSHRRQAGLAALHRRTQLERGTLRAMGAVPAAGFRETLRAWWELDPAYPGQYPDAVRRLSPWRNVELWGSFLADHRTGTPIDVPALTELRRRVHDGSAPRGTSRPRGPAAPPPVDDTPAGTPELALAGGRPAAPGRAALP